MMIQNTMNKRRKKCDGYPLDIRNEESYSVMGELLRESNDRFCNHGFVSEYGPPELIESESESGKEDKRGRSKIK